MKKLIKVIIAIAVIGTNLMAYDIGSTIRCVPYKIYNPETKLSYKLTKTQMEDMIYSVKVITNRIFKDISGKETIYIYDFSNNSNWDIFKGNNNKIKIAFKEQKDHLDGAIILKNNTFMYSYCKYFK